MKTVAVFSTYAPSDGFGGPARLVNMQRVLEAGGLRVVHVVVQSIPDRTRPRPHDLFVLAERPFRAPIDHIYDDVDLGVRAASDPLIVSRVSEHLKTQGVQAIVLEQPFLVDLVERVLQTLTLPVIYSSQNIEFRLRRDLEPFQPSRTRRQRWSEVREVEARAAAMATSITAICPTDQHALRDEFGCESVLVPNGSSITDFRDTRGERSDFVFAGSAYWPNTDGLARIATPSLAFLPPGRTIHLIGSVGKQALETDAIRRRSPVNRPRLIVHGFLPVADMAARLRATSCVIVPVFLGEGSNLKSADALASGAPVIMTRRATAGYEDVLELDSSGVTVVDTAREFREAMLTSIEATPPFDGVGARRADSLTWTARLQPLLAVVTDALAA